MQIHVSVPVYTTAPLDFRLKRLVCALFVLISQLAAAYWYRLLKQLPVMCHKWITNRYYGFIFRN